MNPLELTQTALDLSNETFNGSDITGEVGDGMSLFDLLFSELSSGMGEAMFGVFIAAFVFFVLYYASGGTIGVPAIVMTLGSSWMLTVVPPQYRTVVITIVIVGLAAGVFRVSQKYFLRPNA